MKTKAWEDPIVAEVRKVKEQLAAKFNYDVAAMLQDAQKRERRSGHKLVSVPKPNRKSEHAK